METTAREKVVLNPVDVIDITILVDNSIDDLLPDSSIAIRPPMPWDAFEHEHLIAEHGYSLLLEVFRNGHKESLLYDAGMSRNTVIHNLDVLGTQLHELQAVVLSHGHADHHGGLHSISNRLGSQHLPLLMHPDAWRERKIVFPTGSELKMPPPNREEITRDGWVVMESREPSLVLGDAVLVTGQVDRTTGFEKGFPLQHMRVENGWEPDTWTWDDQAIVCHLKDKGLVILSGCSHAGTINIIRYAQHLTGIDHIHAFVGGLHLTGGIFERIIPQTVDELARIGPDIIVPGHCTGWKATHEIARRLPDAYVQTNVGTRLHLAG